jgi:hypothetical protein
MSVSDVFLDAEFKYVSRISLSPTPFALHQTVKAQAYMCESLGACCNKQTVTCHTCVTNSPLPVAGQSSVCCHLRST